jgi:hypothetical protein
MRSRKEICEDLEENGFDGSFIQHELLLDIRDLLKSEQNNNTSTTEETTKQSQKTD